MNFQKLLANFTLVVTGIVVAFLVSEWASRSLWPNISPTADELNNDNLKLPAPYLMFRGLPNADDADALGYIGELPAMPKPKEEIRVVILGGSTVYSSSLPNRLEKLLRKNVNDSYRAYNFGVPSSKSGEDLARLVFEVADFQPDVVVFYNGANDINEKMGDPRPGYPFNFLVYERNPLLIRDVGSYPAFALFAYGSNLLRKLFYGYFLERFIDYSRLERESAYQSASWMEKSAEIYSRNTMKAQRFAEANGAKFFHFFQPMKNFQDHLLRTGRTEYQVGDEDTVVYGRKLILDKLKSHKQLLSYDLSDIFNKEKPEDIYQRYENGDFDKVHVKGGANRLIAEQIFERLRPKL